MAHVIYPFQLLVITLAGWPNRHQQAFIDYLIDENRVLKNKLDGQRLRSHDKKDTTSNGNLILNCYENRSAVAVAAVFLFVLLSLLWVPVTVLALTPAPQDAALTGIDLTSEERAWLKAHPRIVLGAPTDYPPMIIRQANGSHTGLLVDLFEQISQKLNTRIGLHIEDSWVDVQQKAQNREIDGLAFGGRDPSREAIYNATDFITSTYFSVFARSQDEFQPKRFSDIDGMRIGYKKGARPTRSLLEKLPSAILKPYDTHESLTQALLSRETDVIVAWMSYDHWRKQKLQGTIDKIYLIEEHPVEMVSYIRSDWPELVTILNKAIAALQQDKFPRIINKWFGEWAGRIISNRLNLTAEEMAWISAHPQIMVRVSNFPPFHSTVQGKPTGFSIDLLDRIAALAGFGVSYVSGIPWPEGLEHIRQRDGRVDLLITAVNTADHREIMVFSEDYLELPLKVLTRTDNIDIKDFDDLIGKTVAIEKGYALVNMVREASPDIKVKEVVGFAPAALRAVSSDKADAYIGNLPVAKYHISNLGLVNLKVAASTPFDFHKLGFGVRKDWPELASILDKAMVAIPLKERLALQEKWGFLGSKEAESVSIRDQLSGPENAWLDQKHPVRVRITNYPPYQIIDIDGSEAPQGITIEYLKLIEGRTGIKFEYEVTDQPFAEFLESMKQGKGPEMTALIMPTPEREQYLSFSSIYIASPYVIFLREEGDTILDISALSGKTVAVPRGHFVQEQLARDYPEIRLSLFGSDEEALQALSTSQADAYIGNLTAAAHIIQLRGLTNIKAVSVTPFGDQLFSMGNRSDWPELTSIINKALASITEEEKTAIRNKYLAIKFEQGIDKAEALKWFLIVSGMAAFLMSVFFFWNVRLRKETNLRRESEAQLRSFLERMPIAACLVDKQGNMYYHNKRFIDLFGYTHEEIKTLSDWWPKAYPDDQYRQWVIETWSDCCVRLSEEKGTDIEAKEYSVTCKDGQVREMEISGIVLGEIYLATLIDNTEHNRANEELIKAKEAADAANQAKSIFLANMSHELRTPLHAILGFSRILTRDSSLKAAQKEQLDVINRSGEHLLGMVDDILSLSKIEAGRIELKQEAFDIVQVLQDLSEMMKFRAEEKGLRFIVELEPGLSRYAVGDVGKLRQVVINLLGNAVKYTEKGEVWLRAQSQPTVTPGTTIFQIQVEDTGPGIPKERLEEVFDSFVRVEHAGSPERGTGLGLAIAKALVSMMDGGITVESEPGQGALFQVNIPLGLTSAEEAMPHKAPKAKVVGLQAGQPDWRILVVDDNTENRVLLTMLLNHTGYSVKEADSGAQAIKIFQQWRPHLILMDMRMPAIDGFEATRKIRTLSGAESVKIVAVTAIVLEDRRQDIFAAGCDEIIYKPFQDQDILDTISRLSGAKYRYEDSDSLAEQTPATRLTVEMLTGLPPELRQDLGEAVLVLNMEAIGEVIKRIRALAPETAQSLQVLVNEFEMARIQQLLDEVRDHSEAV